MDLHEDKPYARIPKLLFKFDFSEGQGNYLKIRDCVEMFKGNLEWTLLIDNENINRYKIITPKLYAKNCFDKEEIDFLGKRVYKDTCEKAIKDIPNLAKYFEKILL